MTLSPQQQQQQSTSPSPDTEVRDKEPTSDRSFNRPYHNGTDKAGYHHGITATTTFSSRRNGNEHMTESNCTSTAKGTHTDSKNPSSSSSFPVCQQIGHSCFDLSDKEIGQGGCAVVKLGFLNRKKMERCETRDLNEDDDGKCLCRSFAETTTSDRVAVKIIDKDHILRKMGEKALKYQKDEVQILKRTNREKSDNIIRLLYSHETDRSIIMVLEYCELNFKKYLKKKKEYTSRNGRNDPMLPEYEIQYWLVQIANGLSSLRNDNFVHRDLKPQNIMLRLNQRNTRSKLHMLSNAPRNGYSYSDFTMKIVDFGFARELEDMDLSSTLCGTKPWMAPEQLSSDGRVSYSNKVDLWAVGVIMLQMIIGENPFRNGRAMAFDLQRYIVQCALSENCRNLISRLLDKDPEKRISFEEFFGHPFLLQTNICRDNLQKRRTRSERRSNHANAKIPNNDSSPSKKNVSTQDERRTTTVSRVEQNNDNDASEVNVEADYEFVDDFEIAQPYVTPVRGNLENNGQRKYSFTFEEAGQYVVLVHNEHASWFLNRVLEVTVQVQSDRNFTGMAQPTFQSGQNAQVMRCTDFPLTVSDAQVPCTVSITTHTVPVSESSLTSVLGYFGVLRIPFLIEVVRLC